MAKNDRIIPEHHPAILQAKAKGMITDLVGESKPTAKEQTLNPEVRTMRNGMAWVLPIITRSEANGRDWRARSSRTQQARKVVSRCMGSSLWHLAPFAKWLHEDKLPLAITFIRLGGRKLDAANLGSALKSTEDAVAMMLGIDDGDHRWRVEFRQAPCSKHAVIVEICYVQQGVMNK
jgi:hypothetical protein